MKWKKDCKKVRWSIAGIALILLLQPLEAQASSRLSSYRLSALGTSFSLPSNWTIEKNTEAGMKFRAQDLSSKYDATGFELYVVPKPGNSNAFDHLVLTTIKHETFCSSPVSTSHITSVNKNSAFIVNLNCQFRTGNVSFGETLLYYVFDRNQLGYEFIYQTITTDSPVQFGASTSSIRMFTPAPS